MNHSNHPDDPTDLAERLCRYRPELSPLEVDRLRTEVGRRLARSERPATHGTRFRARLSIVSMLVAGILMTGTGGALAISGISGSGSAAQQQYPDTSQKSSGKVLGVTSSSSTPAPAGAVRAVQQVSSSPKGDLPFTGYLAIPVLLGGIALLGTGLVLRRRAQAPEHRRFR